MTLSENELKAFGLGPESPNSQKVKAGLMLSLQRLIEKEHPTQERAAEALGTTQPRISDLMQGRLGRFSIGALLDMHERAGIEVTLYVSLLRKASR